MSLIKQLKLNKKNYFIIPIFVLVLSISPILSIAQTLKDEQNSRTIKFYYTLQNSTNKPIKKAEFWTFGPVSFSKIQSNTEITSNYQYITQFDKLGNQIFHYTFNNFPPFASKIIMININFKNTFRQNTDELNHDSLDLFLSPEKFVESNAKKIVLLAHSLNSKDNQQKTIENIYQWVINNLSYSGYIKNSRGALWALNNKKGDCTEYMYLFVALCRANKIPARCIGGYVVTKNKIIDASDYHNWAEFFLNGKWEIADPQKQCLMKNKEQYIAMKIMSHHAENHITDFQRFKVSGEGIKVRMGQ